MLMCWVLMLFMVNGFFIIYYYYFKFDLWIDVNGMKVDVFLKVNVGVKLFIKLKLSGSVFGKICCLFGVYS